MENCNQQREGDCHSNESVVIDRSIPPTKWMEIDGLIEKESDEEAKELLRSIQVSKYIQEQYL